MKTKKSKKCKQNRTKRIYLIIGVVFGLFLACSCGMAFYSLAEYDGDDCWIKITGESNIELNDSLMSSLDGDFATRVYRLWYLMGGDASVSQGAYKIKSGMSALSVARKIKNNHQTPVKVVFNSVRTMDKLAERVAKNMQFSETDFLTACDSVLKIEGYKKEEYSAIFFPDSYEFYWNASAESVVKKFLSYYNKFWSDDRLKKAKECGLSPMQVSVIASIVEEETNKADERPMVARLYMNRLDKNMKLQADPTIKFALGDFSLRRINYTHLSVNSPYNTYQNIGLPPGPIRVVSKKTLDYVLNAPQHNYLYMCAKEDFSGYHNFAVDYATHMANARRYQAELNKRKIK